MARVLFLFLCVLVIDGCATFGQRFSSSERMCKRAIEFFHEGKHDRAEEELLRALTTDGNDMHVLLVLSQLYRETDRGGASCLIIRRIVDDYRYNSNLVEFSIYRSYRGKTFRIVSKNMFRFSKCDELLETVLGPGY